MRRTKFLLLPLLSLFAFSCNGGSKSDTVVVSFQNLYDATVSTFRMNKGNCISKDFYERNKGSLEMSKNDFVNRQINSFNGTYKTDKGAKYTTSQLFNTPIYEDTTFYAQGNKDSGVIYTVHATDKSGYEASREVMFPYNKVIDKDSVFNSTYYSNLDGTNRRVDLTFVSKFFVSQTIYKEDNTIEGRKLFKGVCDSDGNNIIGTTALSDKKCEATLTDLKTTYTITTRDIITNNDSISSSTLIDTTKEENPDIITNEVVHDSIGYNDEFEITSDYSDYVKNLTTLPFATNFSNIHTFSGWYRTDDTKYFGNIESYAKTTNFKYEKSSFGINNNIVSTLNENEEEVVYLNATYTPNKNKYRFSTLEGESDKGYICKTEYSVGDIQLPNSVDVATEIEGYEAPKQVNGIGESGFYNSPINSINLNNSLYFKFTPPGNEEIEKIFNATITHIGNNAFRSCYYLAMNCEALVLPTCISSIGTSVFADCPNISRFKLKNAKSEESEEQETGDKTLLLYDGNLYYANKGSTKSKPINLTFVKSVKSNTTINESTVAISDMAFFGDENIEEVVIPSQVATLGKRVFESCVKLKKLNMSAMSGNRIAYPDYFLYNTPIARFDGDGSLIVNSNDLTWYQNNWSPSVPSSHIKTS